MVVAKKEKKMKKRKKKMWRAIILFFSPFPFSSPCLSWLRHSMLLFRFVISEGVGGEEAIVAAQETKNRSSCGQGVESHAHAEGVRERRSTVLSVDGPNINMNRPNTLSP